MRHLIQVLVENRFGVLARIASLFSARGYNIDSLAVGETQDSTISCMTIVVNAPDERILEQIKKQLHKLIDVITVVDLTRKDYIDRELLLVKITKSNASTQVIETLSKEKSFQVLQEKDDCYLVEICADHHVLNEFMKELKKVEIKELVRTGKIAINTQGL